MEKASKRQIETFLRASERAAWWPERIRFARIKAEADQPPEFADVLERLLNEVKRDGPVIRAQSDRLICVTGGANDWVEAAGVTAATAHELAESLVRAFFDAVRVNICIAYAAAGHGTHPWWQDWEKRYYFDRAFVLDDWEVAREAALDFPLVDWHRLFVQIRRERVLLLQDFNATQPQKPRRTTRKPAGRPRQVNDVELIEFVRTHYERGKTGWKEVRTIWNESYEPKYNTEAAMSRAYHLAIQRSGTKST